MNPHQIDKLIKHDFKPDENEHFIEKFLYLLKPCLEKYTYENPLKTSNIYSRNILSQMTNDNQIENTVQKQKKLQEKRVENDLKIKKTNNTKKSVKFVEKEIKSKKVFTGE